MFGHFRGLRLRETVGYLPPRELLGELLLARGLLAMRCARQAEAAELFEQVVARLPETAAAPEAMYWLGTTYYFRGDKARMGQVWQDLAIAYPNSIWSLKTALGPVTQ